MPRMPNQPIIACCGPVRALAYSAERQALTIWVSWCVSALRSLGSAWLVQLSPVQWSERLLVVKILDAVAAGDGRSVIVEVGRTRLRGMGRFLSRGSFEELKLLKRRRNLRSHFPHP